MSQPGKLFRAAVEPIDREKLLEEIHGDAIVVDHESWQLASKDPPFCVLLLLLQFAGGLHVEPITLAPRAFASEMPLPVRVPVGVMPTRRMERPMAFAPLVVKRSSYGTVSLSGINAVLMPKPWMG